MELLLTRRQTLQSLAFAAVGGISLFSLAGCGGHGDDDDGNGAATTTRTRVPVSLPSGFLLPLAELEGGTAYGSGAVDATGFSARVNAKAPTFAYLRHKPTGKFVMFGFVGAGRPGLTPLASATGSLALALGLTGLNGEGLAQALALLEADANAKGLAEAIASAMATDPYALTAEGGAVAAATKTAFDSIRGGNGGGNPTAASRRSDGSGTIAGTRTRGRAPAPLILVAPSEEQGGFRIEQGSAGQIVPTNLRRRPCAAYTYRVGHTPGAGAADQSAAVRIDVQELVSTTTLVGSVLSLGARPAFAPVTGKPITLPIDGDDERTHYETVVLMGSVGWTNDPAVFTQPRYAAEFDEWRNKVVQLNDFTLVGTLADLFKGAGLGLAALTTFEQAAQYTANLLFERVFGNAAVLVARTGGFSQAVQGILRGIVSGDVAGARLVSVILNLLNYGTVTGAELAVATTAITGLAAFTLTALVASGALLAAGDVGLSLWDATTSPTGVTWQETALKASLTITPETRTIAAGADLALTADVVGRPGVTATYTWTLGGSDLATLSDGHGKTGRTIETDQATVTLATTPSTQGEITVSVEAFVGDDVLGPAKATITVTEPQPYVLETFYSLGDGTVTVTLAGREIYRAEANQPHRSVSLADAKKGDAVNIRLSGATTRFSGLGSVFYDQPDGTRIQVYTGVTQTAPYPDPSVNIDFTLA